MIYSVLLFSALCNKNAFSSTIKLSVTEFCCALLQICARSRHKLTTRGQRHALTTLTPMSQTAIANSYLSAPSTPIVIIIIISSSSNNNNSNSSSRRRRRRRQFVDARRRDVFCSVERKRTSLNEGFVNKDTSRPPSVSILRLCYDSRLHRYVQSGPKLASCLYVFSDSVITIFFVFDNEMISKIG